MAGIAPERIGYVLDGKYEILSEVGHGGMSIVYLARDRRLNKQWAVKEFRRTGDRHTDKLFRKSLMEEAQLMKGLDHPALPRIVDIIEADDTIFIVMDFIEGEDLKKVMKKQGHPFTEREVVDLGIQLCDVLDYLHTPVENADSQLSKPTIVYRDMKPQNVMVNDKGVARLIDFGIARKFDGGKDGDTTLGGTEGYAAPEQMDDSVETDPRADIYSLGITLHYLVTGRNPRKDVHNARPIREYNAQLSEGLEAIIAKCTAYRREDRYQSCREVAYDLEHYETLTPEFRAKKKRKVNTFLGLSIAAVVFLVAGIGCLVGSNAVKQSTFEAYYSKGNDIAISADTAQTGNASFDEKIEAYKAAIETDPSQAEPYEAILEAFIYDGEFSSSETDDYYKLMSDSAKDRCSEYADLCYSFANVCFSYTTNYSMAYTWFDNALTTGGLSDEQTVNAETYKAICDFRKNLDSRELLGNSNESATFVTYWNSLVEACDVVEGADVTVRAKLKLYELVMDACSSEAYTTPFMIGGISEDDLLDQIEYVCTQTEKLSGQLVYDTDRTIYDDILAMRDGGTNSEGASVPKASEVVELTYNSAYSTARESTSNSSSSSSLQQSGTSTEEAGE